MTEIRKIQELAWDNVNTPQFWFRRKYNLPPTDPRYLDATKEEILIDYYSYLLLERYQQLTNDGVKDPDLDTLLAEEEFERELDKIKHEEQEELLIDFKA